MDIFQFEQFLIVAQLLRAKGGDNFKCGRGVSRGLKERARKFCQPCSREGRRYAHRRFRSCVLHRAHLVERDGSSARPEPVLSCRMPCACVRGRALGAWEHGGRVQQSCPRAWKPQRQLDSAFVDDARDMQDCKERDTTPRACKYRSCPATRLLAVKQSRREA